MSRMVRVMTNIVFRPSTSIMSGPVGTRPRLGLSPTTPQCEAGMRIEPTIDRDHEGNEAGGHCCG